MVHIIWNISHDPYSTDRTRMSHSMGLIRVGPPHFYNSSSHNFMRHFKIPAVFYPMHRFQVIWSHFIRTRDEITCKSNRIQNEHV